MCGEAVAQNAAHGRQGQVHDRPQPARLVVPRDKGLELEPGARGNRVEKRQQQALAIGSDATDDGAEQVDALDETGERTELTEADERGDLLDADAGRPPAGDAL